MDQGRKVHGPDGMYTFTHVHRIGLRYKLKSTGRVPIGALSPSHLYRQCALKKLGSSTPPIVADVVGWAKRVVAIDCLVALATSKHPPPLFSPNIEFVFLRFKERKPLS